MLYFWCALSNELLELHTNCKIDGKDVEEFLSNHNNLNDISNDFVDIEYNGQLNGINGKHLFQIHKSCLLFHKAQL